MKIFAETERLILREILPTDVDGMFELESDPKVHKYLGNKAIRNKNQIPEIISSIRQQYRENGIGRWAVIDKKNNEFLGWTGLKLESKLTNNHQNYYDLGYRIKSKHWGGGIATETAIISLNYGFQIMNLDIIYAAASCENKGSNRVLQKVGLEFIETFYYEEIKCNWYRIDKNKYKKNQTTKNEHAL